MRRLALVAAVFLIAIGVGTAITISVGADPGGGDEPRGADNKPLPTPRVENPQPNIPDAFSPLSDAEMEAFLAAIERDPTLAPLLKGTSPQLSSVGIWTEGEERIGAGAVLTLPAAVEHGPRDWKLLRQDEDRKQEPTYATKHYVTRNVTLDVTGLTEVMVFVDLRTNEVVSLRPHSYENAQPAAE